VVVRSNKRKNITGDTTDAAGSLDLESSSVALPNSLHQSANDESQGGHGPLEETIAVNSSSGNCDRPLRLLVIGDSLAAGVGTRRSGTPVLPEAVAQALSRALDGRAVLWTCVGVPGQTASEIVHDIHCLEDVLLASSSSSSSLLSSSTTTISLLRQWDEWQTLQRQKAAERIETAKQRTREWIEYCKEQRIIAEESDLNNAAWWKRITRQVRREMKALRIVFQKGDAQAGREAETTPMPEPQHVTSLSDVVGPFDVAIVLTGCNDLKESYLPFMTARRRPSRTSNPGAEPAEESGIQGELGRILMALESKMIRRILPTEEQRHSDQDRDVSNEASEASHDRSSKGPLIVFPAMPFQPTTLGRSFPLSWFVSPLFQMIDRHKQRLSELYPGRVLFVPSPDSATWSDFEAKRGPQWQDFFVLLKLHDIANDAKERIEQLMQRHYAKWVLDQDEDRHDGPNAAAKLVDQDDSLYEFSEMEGVWMRPQWVRQPHTYLGHDLVAPDGIHPSDSGYDMWGRHIAFAIVEEWDRQRCDAS
jgi:lysophospholipase L1-like esterase